MLSWIIFGLVIGLVAHLINPAEKEQGGIGSIFLGILGAVVGGLIASVVIGNYLAGSSLYTTAAALVGALVIVAVQRTTRRV